MKSFLILILAVNSFLLLWVLSSPKQSPLTANTNDKKHPITTPKPQRDDLNKAWPVNQFTSLESLVNLALIMNANDEPIYFDPQNTDQLMRQLPTEFIDPETRYKQLNQYHRSHQ